MMLHQVTAVLSPLPHCKDHPLSHRSVNPPFSLYKKKTRSMIGSGNCTSHYAAGHHIYILFVSCAVPAWIAQSLNPRMDISRFKGTDPYPRIPWSLLFSCSRSSFIASSVMAPPLNATSARSGIYFIIASIISA